jgi:putative flippase GtrA
VNHWPEFRFFAPFMQKHIHNARDLVIAVIDFFYPPFRRLMPLQTFRYAASGGFNTLLGLTIYTISFEYILHRQILDLGFIAFESYSAALFMSFCVNFPLGFFLMKFVVFSDSNIRGRVQLFRYFMLYLVCLFLNYGLLKLFVEGLHIYAVIAQIMTTCVIVLFSYLIQRYYTFKVVETSETEVD